jgi:hypothetical protein
VCVRIFFFQQTHPRNDRKKLENLRSSRFLSRTNCNIVSLRHRTEI